MGNCITCSNKKATGDFAGVLMPQQVPDKTAAASQHPVRKHHGPYVQGSHEDGASSMQQFMTVLSRNLGSVHLDFRVLLEAILVTCSDMLSLHEVTADANYLYVSPGVEDVLGFPQEELIGRPCTDFFHPDEATMLASEITSTVSAACTGVPAIGSTFEPASPMRLSGNIDIVSDRGCFEYRLKTKAVTAEGDPLYAYVETRCIVFRTLDADGTPQGAALILCLTRNVTDKKLRELRDVTHEAKTWAAVARRTLIRYLHHELRAPASNIRLAVDELRSTLDTSMAAVEPCPQKRKEYTKEILGILSTSCDEICDVLNGVAGLANLEDMESPNLANFDLMQVLNDVCATAAAERPHVAIKCCNSVDPALFPPGQATNVVADRHMLSRALIQLINNACDHSGASSIVVRVYARCLRSIENEQSGASSLTGRRFRSSSDATGTQSSSTPKLEPVSMLKLSSSNVDPSVAEPILTVASTNLPETTVETNMAKSVSNQVHLVPSGGSSVPSSVSTITPSCVTFCEKINVNMHHAIPFMTSEDVNAFARHARSRSGGPTLSTTDAKPKAGWPYTNGVEPLQTIPDMVALANAQRARSAAPASPRLAQLSPPETATVTEPSPKSSPAHGSPVSKHETTPISGAGIGPPPPIDLSTIPESFQDSASGCTPVMPLPSSGYWMVLCITVEDNGKGIAQGEAENLFVPYSKLHTSTAGTYRGSGLGLSMVREVCRLHGGRAGLVSAQENGSVFYMLLPVRSIFKLQTQQMVTRRSVHKGPSLIPPAVTRSTSDLLAPILAPRHSPHMSATSSTSPTSFTAQGPGAHNGAGTGPTGGQVLTVTTASPRHPRVLVVDDVISARKLVAAQLHRLGYDTAQAVDGLDALRQILIAAHHDPVSAAKATESMQSIISLGLDKRPMSREEIQNVDSEISAVLLDAEMPFDGYETARILRRWHPHLKIVGVTANVHADDIVRFYRCGITDFLSKPVDRATISECLLRLNVPATHVRSHSTR